jgi:hypothetical protein
MVPKRASNAQNDISWKISEAQASEFLNHILCVKSKFNNDKGGFKSG